MLKNTSRRNFLGASAALGLSAPSFAATIARALATPANQVTGGLGDIEHIVFLMQENRSFDSYFGTLSGVRGFSDPRAIMLPSGKPVWHQPNGTSEVLPYHFDIRNTNALRIGLDHSWKGSESTWKDWNVWVPKKSARSMGFFSRSDLPFYYAVADAFTVCDDYHCSVFGPTDPNRFYALTGKSDSSNMTGLQNGSLYNVNNGKYNADIANDSSAAGLAWQTYAEVLEANNVSWKVYQEWDNYGDNYLQYFKNFRVDALGNKLTPSSPLYQKGRAMSPGSTSANAASTTNQWLIDNFAADVKAGTLPQVSWICASTEYCEHPSETPNAGENFTARLLAALVDNPEVWSKTAFIITYDENDGFFDHMPSTMAPLNADRGRTTLTDATIGEIYNGQPIGVGPRVPTMVLSPWSKGGRVCSQLFDHTSLIRFVEEWLVQGRGLSRSNVQCPNISPWRRAVCGDLTSAFDFTTPDAAWPDTVPDTALYFKGWGNATPVPPAVQTLPAQETAAQPRAASPLPYRCEVDGVTSATARQLTLNLSNAGSAAATFIVYSLLRTDGPWHYTVEPGKSIDGEVWNWSAGKYHLSAHSHNGFMREFTGVFDSPSRLTDVMLDEQSDQQNIRVVLTNNGSMVCSFKIADNAYGDTEVLTVEVGAGQKRSFVKSLVASHGWYDLGITLAGDTAYWRRLAGHLEGAGLNFTDPVLNGLARAVPSPSPGTVTLPPAPVVTFTGTASLIRVGDSIGLTWKNLPAGTKHWIGAYRVGQVPGGPGSLKWNYISGSSGTQQFSGLPEGQFFLGLFLDDGYAEAAARLPVRVVKRGDVNADGAITAADRDALRGSLNTCEGQPRYQALADLDGDKCITQADYQRWYEVFTAQ